MPGREPRKDRGSYGADIATGVTQSCYRPVDPVGKYRQSGASRRAPRRFRAHDPQSRHPDSLATARGGRGGVPPADATSRPVRVGSPGTPDRPGKRRPCHDPTQRGVDVPASSPVPLLPAAETPPVRAQVQVVQGADAPPVRGGRSGKDRKGRLRFAAGSRSWLRPPTGCGTAQLPAVVAARPRCDRAPSPASRVLPVFSRVPAASAFRPYHRHLAQPRAGRGPLSARPLGKNTSWPGWSMARSARC